jgi:hypothetical protein
MATGPKSLKAGTKNAPPSKIQEEMWAKQFN